jgi:hypothetical protein
MATLAFGGIEGDSSDSKVAVGSRANACVESHRPMEMSSAPNRWNAHLELIHFNIDSPPHSLSSIAYLQEKTALLYPPILTADL